jgi:hypothetical protein
MATPRHLLRVHKSGRDQNEAEMAELMYGP